MRLKITFFGAGLFVMTAFAPCLASAATVAVNAATTYQTITGFGASSAWNTISTTQAPVLWADDSAAAVTNTAGHVNGHAGLSMLRTRIDPTEETAGTGVWAAESANMTTALGQNANIHIWSSEWTPPNADKLNNAAYSAGNTNSFNGLPTTANNTAGTAASDTDYSNYLVKYVNYIKSNIGINLYAVSVQNEPDYNPTSYESALWTGQQFDTFVGTYLGPAFKTAAFSTKIIITESFSENLALAQPTMDDAVAAPYVGVIAGHLYGDMTSSSDTGTFINPEPISVGNFSHYTNQDYWETEMSDVSGAGFDAGMQTGLQEAYWIHTCIVDWGMNAFHHWWINGTDNSSLYDTTTNTWSDKLYVLGNFAKFIRPGFARIAATEAPQTGVTVSAYDITTTAVTRVVIVAINKNTSAVSQAFSLAGLNCTSMAVWVTDSGNQLVQQTGANGPVALSADSFTYTLPAQSVVSFVGDCVSASTPTDTPSATRTTTPTASPSASRTLSPSATGTLSSTRTATLSFSPTSSASRTLTSSPSPSLTPTVTATRTATPGPSLTDSPTASLTLSPSSSATLSPSGTATPLDTTTLSSTPTGSATSSPTASASPTATLSDTASPMNSPTLSPSPATSTDTPSETASSTATPSTSATASASSSATATRSFTATATPSFSATLTALPAASATPSFTPQPTSQPTPFLSSLGTLTLTAGVAQDLTLTGGNFTSGDWVLINGTAYQPFSVSSTQIGVALPAQDQAGTAAVQVGSLLGGSVIESNTENLSIVKPEDTATSTPVLGGPLTILGLDPVPNPNPGQLALKLAGPADSVTVRVFTKALVLALEFSEQNLHAGWQSFPLPSAWAGLPNGIYYVQVQAKRGQTLSQAEFTKAMLLK